MKEIVFATNNAHKLNEVRAILEGRFKILSLRDIGCYDEIPETADTLRENAFIKASWVKEKYGFDCFADDTGLEVAALGGAPGVFSARYAGENVTYKDNCDLLLKNMAGIIDRKARFLTCICLIYNGVTRYFEGEIKGEIIEGSRGDSGFGYDPIFIPEGHELTFAQMASELKNSMSHRFRAVYELNKFFLHTPENEIKP